MSTAAATPQPPDDAGPRIAMVGGGRPTPAQLAAVIVALTPVASAASHDGAPRVPAWTAAALREGVGQVRVSSLADLAGRP